MQNDVNWTTIILTLGTALITAVSTGLISLLAFRYQLKLNHYALKVHRLHLDWKSLSLKYEHVAFTIAWFSVVLQILLHHLFRDVSCAPRSISYRPEMFAPVSSLQLRIFLLEQSRGSPFDSSYQIWHRFRWRIFYVHMHMVFAHYSFEYLDIFRVADLHDQISAPNFYIPLQHMVSVFRYPDYMCCKSRNAVAVVAILLHSQTSNTRWDV